VALLSFVWKVRVVVERIGSSDVVEFRRGAPPHGSFELRCHCA
jgi:hypothetical protein